MATLNLLVDQRQTQGHRGYKLVVTKEGFFYECNRVGGWLADVSYYIQELINNRILLCGIRNYIQYFGISYNGKEYIII